MSSEDPEVWAKEIQKVHRKGRKVRLEEAVKLRKKFSETYKWEEQCSKLVEKILEVVRG